MADTDPEGKSGGTSKAGNIAIATAIIGAITTISVAYINKGPSSAEVRPAPPSPQPDDGAAPKPAPEPADVDVPTVQPQPLMQTTRNIAGLWTAADGEQIEIAQTGSQLVINGGIMTEAGVVVWQGYGRIVDRKVNWTAQAAANGNQIEIECNGRLTSTGNSIQGTCDAMGQQGPFQYSR